MNKEKLLLKNTAIVAIGQICTKFVGFFLLPLYTAVLSTEEYGIVDILNTYVSLLLPIAFFQIDQGTFRFLIDARNDENEKRRLISTVLITVILQSIVYILFFIFISQYIKNDYKYFLATNVLASMFSNLMLQIARGLGDNSTYSLGSLLSGSGTIILNVIFIVIFKWGAYGMLSASCIANCLCTLFVFLKEKIYIYVKLRNYSLNEIKKIWKYSLPMVPNQLSWWVINASDRTIITYILGVGINGIYSAANKFSTICIAIFNVFNLTWTESASIYVNDKESEEYFSNIFNITMKLFVSLCLGIIAFMPFVFKIFITGDSYADAYYQIPILLIATIFNISVSMLGSIYVALKKTGEIAKTSLLAALINICVNLLLIRFIGLYAASISTLIAFFSMTLYRYRDVQKYKKIKVDKKFVISSIIFGLYILLVYYMRNNYLCGLGAICAIIFTYMWNKNVLLGIIKWILNKFKVKK